MSTPITTGAHPKALWPGVYRWTHLKYKELPTQYTDIFGALKSSDMAYEETVEATGFGLATMKTEGGPVSYEGHSQGPTTTYRHAVYGKGYVVTMEEIADNLYPKLTASRSESLARSMRQTKEIVGANILNRGFNSAFPGADGVELFSTLHPVVDGSVQSNELAIPADLSEAALEDLMIMIATAQNNRGLQAGISAVCLIVHPNNMFEAHRIMNTTLRPGTANNDTNAMREMGVLPGGIKVNRYLDDEDAFFLKTDVQDGLMGFQRMPFTVSRDNEFNTENAFTKALERYSFGWSDFRGMYASAGA